MADLRTQCFKGEMARGNWDLSELYIDANGVDVFGDWMSGLAVIFFSL